jgi:hypothetical protein
MTGQIATGYLVGNGAAINVSLGWYPDHVRLVNLTDGDITTEAHLGKLSVPFSSGGTNTLTVGNIIVGATSGSRATLKNVLVYSGTWAAGDAAGFLIVDDQSGTFASENVYILDNAAGSTNDATITAAVAINITTAAAVAAATGNSAMSRYAGTSALPKGFTIGSTLAEEAKLLWYIATRGDEYVGG